jgi:hypothetical protein
MHVWLIVVLVVAYLLVGAVVVGVHKYRHPNYTVPSDTASLLAGLFWPLAIVIGLLLVVANYSFKASANAAFKWHDVDRSLFKLKAAQKQQQTPEPPPDDE